MSSTSRYLPDRGAPCRDARSRCWRCFVPATAQAGTYEVWSCADADGKPVARRRLALGGLRRTSRARRTTARAATGSTPGSTAPFAHAANTETADVALPGAGVAEDRRATASGARPAPSRTRQREPGLLDGAPAERIHRRLRRRARELPGLRRRSATPPTTSPPPTSSQESGLADVRDLFLNAGCGGAGGLELHGRGRDGPDAVYFRMYRAAIVLQDDADPVFTSPPAGSLTAGGALVRRAGRLVLGHGHRRRHPARAMIEVDGSAHGAEQHRLRAPVHRGRAVQARRERHAVRSTPRRSPTDRTACACWSPTRPGRTSPPSARSRSRPPTRPRAARRPRRADLAVGVRPQAPTIAYGGKLNVVGQAPRRRDGPGLQPGLARRRAGELGRTPIVADATGSSPTASRPARRARCASPTAAAPTRCSRARSR